MTTLPPTTSQSRLKMFAAIAAVLAVLQLLTAITMLSMRNGTLFRIHEGVGFLYALAAILTCFPAKVWGDLSHNKGLPMHAYGMAAAGIVQVLLGLFADHIPGATAIHMILGVLIAAGAVALSLLAAKKPIIVTAGGIAATPDRPAAAEGRTAVRDETAVRDTTVADPAVTREPVTRPAEDAPRTDRRDDTTR